jgi:pheromone shutdown protein TraB
MYLGAQSFSLNSIPNQDLILDLMKKVKNIYPSVYKILVHDRNKFMATNLHNIMLKNPDKNILAVVGAGHVPGMIELLKKYDK